MIKFSSTTTDLIFDVQDFTGRKIRHITPVSILIDNTYSAGDIEVFKNLVFKAKYLKGLKNISLKDISSQNIDTKTANEKIVNEITREINNLTTLIREIISKIPKVLQDDFEINFFQMDNNSLMKYYELIEDLSMFKEYFNANS